MMKIISNLKYGVLALLIFTLTSCLDEDICTPNAAPELTLELRNVETNEVFTDTIFYNQIVGEKEDGTWEYRYSTHQKLQGKQFNLTFIKDSVNSDILMEVYRRSDLPVYDTLANGDYNLDAQGKKIVVGYYKTKRDIFSFSYELGQSFENTSCGGKVIFDNVNYQLHQTDGWIKNLNPVTTDISDNATVNLHVQTLIFNRINHYQYYPL